MAANYIDVGYRDRATGIAAKSVTAAVTAITQANPAVVTAAAHGFADGDKIEIDTIVGMVELNDRSFVVANKTDDTFELAGEDSTGHTAYTSGGIATKLMSVTSDIRVMFDTNLKSDQIVNAVQRAKEALIALLT